MASSWSDLCSTSSNAQSLAPHSLLTWAMASSSNNQSRVTIPKSSGGRSRYRVFDPATRASPGGIVDHFWKPSVLVPAVSIAATFAVSCCGWARGVGRSAVCASQWSSVCRTSYGNTMTRETRSWSHKAQPSQAQGRIAEIEVIYEEDTGTIQALGSQVGDCLRLTARCTTRQNRHGRVEYSSVVAKMEIVPKLRVASRRRSPLRGPSFSNPPGFTNSGRNL